MAELKNTHNIQAQKRYDAQGGKPEVYDSQSYLITVDVENVNACKKLAKKIVLIMLME